MKEREQKKTDTSSVRELSHKILQNSKNILEINPVFLKKHLLPALQKFQNEAKPNFDPFANDELSAENELGLNLFLDVVNFCYQDPGTGDEYTYVNKEGKTIRRATGLTKAMAESDINWGDFKEVSEVSPKEWVEIAQLDQNPNFYLGKERGARISGFARKLKIVGFTNVTDLLVSTEYKTELLLPFLNKSGYFNDEFQKRSQLAVNMLNGVLKRRFNKELKGADSLTVMADYRLPQLMYNSGAINLSVDLWRKLLRQEIIETGSPEELALRAVTVVIGEKLAKLMGITEGEVDSLLWSLSQKMAKENKLTIPHMLIATDKY